MLPEDLTDSIHFVEGLVHTHQNFHEKPPYAFARRTVGEIPRRDARRFYHPTEGKRIKRGENRNRRNPGALCDLSRPKEWDGYRLEWLSGDGKVDFWIDVTKGSGIGKEQLIKIAKSIISASSSNSEK
ncbi:hypothetical protein WJ0W_003775 [Paenibacillus melissococcoides]|uniref:Uncharacterized protein n=1 Tax=Paenibacillus melissococcoides TaxID=2912268 RepID=A0ABN8U5Y9_9BACL|nr:MULTISPECIES: hypothetical protein [Paenibacillus]MEB9895480.1 hypothetical protein [Bacillus cereus]CAH8246540.1 hypothetical protein WJ0W_003775 [Paenibacillus melissococcoides]CAH8715052.1 hypothetical protein HTL2_004147 [Paenibacillus melissococcoides]CAH8716005.1 hypothetical protein WDD9_004414 [Paenibacillus melissococcoides]